MTVKALDVDVRFDANELESNGGKVSTHLTVSLMCRIVLAVVGKRCLIDVSDAIWKYRNGENRSTIALLVWRLVYRRFLDRRLAVERKRYNPMLDGASSDLAKISRSSSNVQTAVVGDSFTRSTGDD